MRLEPLYVRIFIGAGIKSIGYLIVAVGIFLSLKDKSLAIKVVYTGVCFVVFGWFVIIRSLKLAKSVGSRKYQAEKAKARISAHISGKAFISEGDSVKIKGRVFGYDADKKTWKPLSGEVLVLVNGFLVGRISTTEDGFEFTLPNLKRGRYEIEVRYVNEPCVKTLRFNVMSQDEKNRLIRLVRLIILLSVISTIFAVYLIVRNAGGGI